TLGIWGDEELVSFEAMVAPWESDTGNTMEFTGERGVGALITTRVEGGNPPDVAIPAEMGLFQDLARAGELVPLSSCAAPEPMAGAGLQAGNLEEYVRANYPPAFIDLGTVDGTLYGFFMKADGKGTIWYNPGFFTDNSLEPLTADSSFDDLLALSQQIADAGTPPWSIGVESAADSGWPGTDWVQAILVNSEGGAEVNDGLIDGSVPFTDPAVVAAWEAFGEIALNEDWVSQGGAEGINATNFVDAIYPPFADPPAAALHHQAGFAAGEITAQFPDAVPGEDYDFFPWPGGAVIGSANVVFAFNDDEATCSFMAWLASSEAQQIWVELGGFTSVNTEISLDSYPDAVTQSAAARLTEAEVFRFDLDDSIGGEVQRAFFAGVTEFLAEPDSLNDILANIEAQRGAEAAE
ncbi:MAG: extracellular solute-binding protein, partial [Dehalococcoidia bacterium]